MGIALSNLTLVPICDCCDNFVKYVLNGCKSECGSSKCCICKIEVMNHSADEFIESEGEHSKQVLSTDSLPIITGCESRGTQSNTSQAFLRLNKSLMYTHIS